MKTIPKKTAKKKTSGNNLQEKNSNLLRKSYDTNSYSASQNSHNSSFLSEKSQYTNSQQSYNKSVLYGAISAIGIFLILSIPTALLPIGLYKRMIVPTILDYAFLFIVPALFGYFIYLYSKHKTSSTNTCAAIGGAGAGWFAVICPICTSFLVYIFGASSLLMYFDPIRPFFGLLSIIVLVILIYRIRIADKNAQMHNRGL
ncbi:MAG: hypothetical protein HZB65_01590 [Candidatus Aenigmarchaeota archaeon]|nr:hypothetical protein [Candidatus Aenigmarchaeota archaeon]